MTYIILKLPDTKLDTRVCADFIARFDNAEHAYLYLKAVRLRAPSNTYFIVPYPFEST